MQAPILQLLSGASQGTQAASLAQIKQAIANIRSMTNPQAALQQMLQQRNPQLMQALDYVKQSGGNPKAAFEKLAKERGIDPAEIETLMK